MNKISYITALILVALISYGCETTHSLLHEVGTRQENPGKITQAWTQKDTLVIDYTAYISDWGGNAIKGSESINRQAVFDLSNNVIKPQGYNIGQIRTNMPPMIFPANDWTSVPFIRKDLASKNLLNTNAFFIEGSRAGAFNVIRNSAPTQSNEKKPIYCRLTEKREWELWWRRPALVMGFPFACAIDVVVVPFKVAVWGLYVLTTGGD